MNTLVVNDLGEFVSMYNRNLNVINSRLNTLMSRSRGMSSRVSKSVLVSVIFGAWAYTKIKDQQAQIKMLKKELDALKQEVEDKDIL